MRICRDERATRSSILPTVGEREGERIGRYGEGPERGSRDKTWGDGRDQINPKNGLTRAVQSNGAGEGRAQARRRGRATVRATVQAKGERRRGAGEEQG
jgi:hypothetical protein